MNPPAPDLYRRALDARPPDALAEPGSPPPERWLQQVWRHQCLRRDHLALADGRPLRVLHPGFWNREPGPDFRRAVLQFGDDPPVQGDVEVDLEPGGWRGHGHAGNPAYRGVILRVLWRSVPPDTPAPVFLVEPHLERPIGELAAWLQHEAPARSPDHDAGRCQGPLADVDPAAAGELLTQAARVRLERKADRIAARARDVGWDQALWEALFAGLGYKRNPWPFRRLAEITSPARDTTGLAPAPDLPSRQARLLGLAGWLPDGRRRPVPSAARRLWDAWWRDRAALQPWILPREAWNLAAGRPANHPQRRIALAAHWFDRPDLPARLVPWLLSPGKAGRALDDLVTLLNPSAPDPFWSRHWTFYSARLPRDLPLLGHPRATDLAINAILPWLHARARTRPDPDLLAAVERRLLEWPAASDNALLRLAARRLFGGRLPRLPRRAVHQQGILQVIGDYCDHADARCAGCRFPDLVRAM